jgi:hypothetical protein
VLDPTTGRRLLRPIETRRIGAFTCPCRDAPQGEALGSCHGFVDPAGALVLGVLAAGLLAGFSFMEKYQSPAIATMQAPMSILRTSGVISVSSLQSGCLKVPAIMHVDRLTT